EVLLAELQPRLACHGPFFDVGDFIRREAAVGLFDRQYVTARCRLPIAVANRNEVADADIFGAEFIRPVLLEEAERYEREIAQVAAEEVGAEMVDFVESGRIAVEGCVAARCRLAVEMEERMRAGAVIGPRIGNVMPVVGAPLHQLLPIRVPRAELQR